MGNGRRRQRGGGDFEEDLRRRLGRELALANRRKLKKEGKLVRMNMLNSYGEVIKESIDSSGEDSDHSSDQRADKDGMGDSSSKPGGRQEPLSISSSGVVQVVDFMGKAVAPERAKALQLLRTGAGGAGGGDGDDSGSLEVAPCDLVQLAHRRMREQRRTQRHKKRVR